MARRRFDPTELARGRQVELEHVDDALFAEEIARDHLREHPQYYSRLEACDVEGTKAPACPTCARPNPCHRNRGSAPEGYRYMVNVAMCRQCGFRKLVFADMDLNRLICVNCGSRRGYELVPEGEIEDAEQLMPRENPSKFGYMAPVRRRHEEKRCFDCGRHIQRGNFCKPCLEARLAQFEHEDVCQYCGSSLIHGYCPRCDQL